MARNAGITMLAVVTALVLAGCGGHGDDHASGGETASSGLSLDRAFAAEMIPHHESAIEMAVIAQDRGESAFVRRLAESIVNSQTDEIATLEAAEARLAKAGAERGTLGLADHMMGMDGHAESLRTADAFDEAFLKMMIPHHEGAVAMAEIEIAKGQDPDLKALAQEIQAAQEREISEMRTHLGDDAPPSDHG